MKRSVEITVSLIGGFICASIVRSIFSKIIPPINMSVGVGVIRFMAAFQNWFCLLCVYLFFTAYKARTGTYRYGTPDPHKDVSHPLAYMYDTFTYYFCMPGYKLVVEPVTKNFDRYFKENSGDGKIAELKKEDDLIDSWIYTVVKMIDEHDRKAMLEEKNNA